MSKTLVPHNRRSSPLQLTTAESSKGNQLSAGTISLLPKCCNAIQTSFGLHYSYKRFHWSHHLLYLAQSSSCSSVAFDSWPRLLLPHPNAISSTFRASMSLVGPFSVNILILLFLLDLSQYPSVSPHSLPLLNQSADLVTWFMVWIVWGWFLSFCLRSNWVLKSMLFAYKFTWHLHLHVQSYLKYKMSQTDAHKTSIIDFSVSYCNVIILLAWGKMISIYFFYPWSFSFSYTFQLVYQEILLALLPKYIEPNFFWPLPLVQKCLNSYHLSVGQLPWPLAIILHIKGVLWLYHLQFFLTV